MSQHLDRIQASALALDDAELSVLVLGEQGLVLSTHREFPFFLRGMAAIYSEPTPTSAP